MGTDIHLYVERKLKNGRWEALPPPEPPPLEQRVERDKNGEPVKNKDGTLAVRPFWGPGDCFFVSPCYGPSDDEAVDWNAERSKGHEKCRACLGTGRTMRWYRNRNYDVFAMLTGTVRNGSGFAGVKTGDGFVGITRTPRGVPKDLSATIKCCASWDHSESWLLVSELLAYDWNGQTTKHTGVIPLSAAVSDPFMIDRTNYDEWRKSPPAPPASYSGGISGPGIVIVGPELADKILDANGAPIDLASAVDTQERKRLRGTKYDPKKHIVYVQVEWSETYSESAQDFVDFMNQYLVPLGDPTKHRIVFGFDS